MNFTEERNSKSCVASIRMPLLKAAAAYEMAGGATFFERCARNLTVCPLLFDLCGAGQRALA